MARRRRRPRRDEGKPFWWARLPREELLDVRLCDLGVTLDDTWLEIHIETVRHELDRKGLRINPHFWLSEEWFCPEGVPGVAIPFYLTHPRLVRLERYMMLEVEGGTHQECLKILRHEVGHAVDHAYNLHRKRRWQKVFGRSSKAYPDYYRPNPHSKNYVQHLDYWYAQAHPDEDFAETFAVWLAPRSNWRKRYKGWPAMRKLRMVDQLLKEVADTPPKVRTKRRVDSLPRLRKTLREYYDEKRERYSEGFPDIYDRELKELFSNDPKHRKTSETAAAFLRRNRMEIRHMVARWTGEYEFVLDMVMKEMILRCQALKLRAVGPKRQLKLDFAILLTVKTMHHLYTSPSWIPV